MPDKTFRYDSGPSLAREIDADVRALVARYPGYVDDQGMLYTGFSLGAILGVAVITRDPARFPRLAKLPDAGQFIHWYNGPVAEETRAAEPWLFEGDARWGADSQ